MVIELYSTRIDNNDYKLSRLVQA